MTGYPALSDIEVRWRTAGSGVCVIVEGETELEDAWFYNRWFASRARAVTFFPQDGWEKVVEAVAALRASLGDTRVFGIIDRDFEDHVAYTSVPSDGILRTSLATLENYLLEPECWFRYVHPVTLRAPKPGWDSPDDAAATIAGLYQECAPVAAYNWTLHEARKADLDAFRSLRRADQEYKEHPKALAGLGDVPAHLRGLQAQMGMRTDLGQVYQERLDALRSMSLAELGQVVSGKYVHNLLRERFPLGLSGRQAWDDVLGAYLFNCQDPPDDLLHLVNLILALAGA